MEDYSQILNIAIPIFFGLILIEWGVGYWMGKKVLRSFDTIASLSSGVTNVTKDVLGLAVVIVSYDWMVSNLAIFHIESTIIVYVLAFIGIDFAGYWSHRFEHEVNILWNRHIIHHSSEEYNLACALRQNVSAIFAVFFFLLIPLALIGVPAQVITVLAPLHLFAQFWYHTRLIDKMGFLENVIVTPSHHRVHHAINDEYLDKNFSQIFIIWDKLFGTFQEELASTPAVFGVKKQVNTWNPFIINYQHFWLLVTDAWYTTKWWDKVRVFFNRTGWRPADRIAAAPIVIIEDPYSVEKYDTRASKSFNLWMWLQLVVIVALALYLFSQLSTMGTLSIVLYGLFVMINIFAYTSLMDRSILGPIFSAITLVLVSAIMYVNSGWITLSATLSTLVLGFYFVSLLVSIYFMKTEPLEPQAEVSFG